MIRQRTAYARTARARGAIHPRLREHPVARCRSGRTRPEGGLTSHRGPGHEMYDVHASSPAGGSSPIPQTSTPRTASRRSSRRASSILVWASSWLSGVERSCPRQTRSGCPGSWRRFKQALAGMDDAGGAEDFQAIGIKCRDSLLAAVRDHICGLGRQRRGPAEGQRTRLAGPGGGQAPARRQGS